MNIEIFSALNTCEQGCSTCPMARKDKSVSATEIDKNVQESFSLLEKVFNDYRVHYNLHTTSSFRLFPDLVYPKLVRMARFETSKSIVQERAPREFSENVHAWLDKQQMHPRIIGFSIVPQSPIVSLDDGVLIKELLQEIGSWHFKKLNSSIDVTVRSNLIKMQQFDAVLPHLFGADRVYLKSIIQEKFRTFNHKSPVVFSYADGKTYFARYAGQNKNGKVMITNRVIGAVKQVDTIKANLAQVHWLYPKNEAYADFAIAPQGVMLMHTSLAINNPILWISHDDFRISLLKSVLAGSFSPLKFIQKLILENISMYKVFPKHLKENEKITNDQFKILFQRYRPSIK